MAAGEWASGSVFRYLDESTVDATRVLQVLVDESGDEGEAEAL